MSALNSFSPVDLQSRSLPVRLMAVGFGTVLLAISSRIEVPMVPVPVTMQTFTVAMIGALYGWRLGTLTVLAWLGQAALGLPVLAGGAGGLAHFAGPTGGYLVAFAVMAAQIGWLAEHGWNGDRAGLAFLSMLAGNLLCLALGAAWLSRGIGWDAAITHGVLPFLVGAVLKSAVGALALRQLGRPRRA